MDLGTERAGCSVPCQATCTPAPTRDGTRPTCSANRKLVGPSLSASPAKRIAPVKSTAARSRSSAPSMSSKPSRIFHRVSAVSHEHEPGCRFYGGGDVRPRQPYRPLKGPKTPPPPGRRVRRPPRRPSPKFASGQRSRVLAVPSDRAARRDQRGTHAINSTYPPVETSGSPSCFNPRASREATKPPSYKRSPSGGLFQGSYCPQNCFVPYTCHRPSG